MISIIDLHSHIDTLPAWILKLCKIRGQKYSLNDHFHDSHKVILSVSIYAPPYTGYSYLLKMIDNLRTRIEQRPEIKLILNAQDLDADYQLGLILHLESGRFITKPRTEIPELFQKGIRGIIPLHYIDNQYGSSCDDPLRRFGLKSRDQGITPLARELVKICNDLKIWIDVTHTTDKCAYQFMEISNHVMASHMGIFDSVPKRRNKDLKFFGELQAKGGVWGLSPWEYTLGPGEDAFKQQLEFALSHGLGESACIGTDFGAPIQSAKHTKGLLDLLPIVRQLDSGAEKVLFQNALTFLKRALP
jgi:microsomal dipeptidase-like Zn-dependent dipeptidase